MTTAKTFEEWALDYWTANPNLIPNKESANFWAGTVKAAFEAGRRAGIEECEAKLVDCFEFDAATFLSHIPRTTNQEGE